MSSPTVFCAEGFALDGLGNCLPTSPGVGAPVRSVLAPSPQKRTSSQGFSSCPAGQAYNAARGGCFPLTPTPPLPTCPGGSHYSSASKTCIHDCPPGQTYDENHGGCVSPCPPGKELNITGDCVKSGPKTCPIGQIFNAIELRCVSKGGFLVQAGESTSAVAARAGVAVEALVAANPTVPRVLVGGRAVFAVLRERQELLLP